MADLVDLASDVLRPDATRTLLRPFLVEDPTAGECPRTRRIIDRILSLDAASLQDQLRVTTRVLNDRHRDPDTILLRRFEDLKDLVVDRPAPTLDQQRLIGSYFSEEFSFESAALFNPSVVRHPDQSRLAAGDLRLLLSLRGVGEGHVSSVVFRSGTWRADGALTIDAPSRFAVGPKSRRWTGRHGELVVELTCEGEKDVSETVIYPFRPSQGRGIEDLRLVEFTDEDGSKDYRGTYTAFSGSNVRQGLLRTTDFKSFEMRGVLGDLYSGKGMALFPRKIGGAYMMLGRQDNENIWLLSSDEFDTWSGGQVLLSPRRAWEFIQIGNCGSPIEIDEGWLVLTHGVGVIRNYCIGAYLLDKADPSKVLARSARPLLAPERSSRDGYVPNVVYSCGSIVRGRTLLIPYGVADTFSAFATVKLDELLKVMD